jgi:DNA (cytosine-5)-methyltransferase 1
MAKNKIVFRLGELFCGPGGLACGAELAKGVQKENTRYMIEHAWATDYDADTCATYRQNFFKAKPSHVVCADIRTLDWSILGDISPIDALAFGFPCNDYSLVGEQKGIHGTFGPLYAYGVQALKRFKPKWFLAENVGGLSNSNDGKTFERILNDLFDAGYSVYPHLYKFEKYGVPQARHRIIIIGIRKDIPILFNVPSDESYKGIDVSAQTAIECPPIAPDALNNELTRQSLQVIERLKHIRPGENAVTAKLPKELELNVKGAKISQIYKRLDPKRPAYTVTGSGGGGTHIYHWSENRALTNRERARLQTFPDNFVFSGSKEKVRKQIGMAVPCRGAQVILSAVLQSFAGIEYPMIKPSFPTRLHKEHQVLKKNKELK